MDSHTRPLTGIIVLDLSDEPLAFGARLLAELGAEVVRVEHPEHDPLRARPPFVDGVAGAERSYAHLLYNAGKRSVALDLSSDGARSALERLATASDVVMAPLEKDERVRELLDRLAAVEDGPGIVDVVFRRDRREDAATDLIATAAGGLLTLNGHPEDPPNYPAGQLAYKEAGLAAAEAALALIIERRRTGRAGMVTISLQEAANFTTVQTSNANVWHWQERIPDRHAQLSGFTTYCCADGEWLSFTVHPPNWLRYAEWVAADLGEVELLGAEWSDPVFRVGQVRRQAAITAALCARHTRAEMIAEGQARGLLALPVNSLADIARDPHLDARGFFADVEQPGLGRSLRIPRTAFLSDAYEAAAASAPALGQHTEEVLRSIAGLSETDVDELLASGAAAGPRRRKVATERADVPAPARLWPAGRRHQPLEGVRILDFCWAIAGPLGTRLLADLGADVIKVESEYRLDPIRTIGVQPKGTMSWNTVGQFNDCNVNKRAITLNLNTPEGIEVARQLAARADVVTSNYTPDRLERWGLGYDALRAIRPDIIVANWAVMGIRGPHSGWRSYGSGIVAMCGLAHLTGFPGRDPFGLGTLHTDFTVPYFGATQVMAALLHRERTGQGQYLELAQYEASIHLLDTELIEHLNGDEPAGPPGQPLPMDGAARCLSRRRAGPLARARLPGRRRLAATLRRRRARGAARPRSLVETGRGRNTDRGVEPGAGRLGRGCRAADSWRARQPGRGPAGPDRARPSHPRRLPRGAAPFGGERARAGGADPVGRRAPAHPPRAPLGRAHGGGAARPPRDGRRGGRHPCRRERLFSIDKEASPCRSSTSIATRPRRPASRPSCGTSCGRVRRRELLQQRGVARPQPQARPGAVRARAHLGR